mgnify:CR=1 FL=1
MTTNKNYKNNKFLSSNFSLKTRSKKHIKHIVIHYTGMQSEVESLKKLCNPTSGVSSHFFIKRSGKILCLVPEEKIAWHAGKSRWGKFNGLNKYSIGIEISNKGHRWGYQKFTKKQLNNLSILCRRLMSKYFISKKNVVGHSDIAPDRKKDPGEKFPWEFLAKKNIGIWHNLKDQDLKNKRGKKISGAKIKKFKKNLQKIGYFFNYSSDSKSAKNVIIAFQRHFRQELVNGRLDQECFDISKAISNKI